MKAKARLTYEKLDHTKDKEAHLVVSLTAPKLDWEQKRPNICIIPVIDISGSMAGQKLDYAKKSVLKLIDHLQPGDYCGLVVFESSVATVSPPLEMTQAKKDELKVKVGELQTMGGTNFSGGMLEGLAHANKMDLPSSVIIRVIMFTDGCANEGIATKREQILPLLQANIGKASVSAFGYGQDADQDLLADVAKTGNGNYAFVKNPDDALSAFARELGGLLSTYAQNVVLEVSAHGDHRVTDVISDVDSEQQGDKLIVKLPDILSEETRHIVFAMSIAKQPNAFPRPSTIVDVKLDYDILNEWKRKEHFTDELKGKIEFVKPGEENKEPIKEVMDLAGNAILVQKQLEAEDLARAGDYMGAQGVMQNLGSVFNFLNMHQHAAAASNLGSKMADAHTYTASSGCLRSFSRGASSGYTVSCYDPEAELMLGSLHVPTSNSAQDAVVKSFIDVGDMTPDEVQGALSSIHTSMHSNPAPVAQAPVVPFSNTNKPPVSSKPSSLHKKKSKRW